MNPAAALRRTARAYAGAMLATVLAASMAAAPARAAEDRILGAGRADAVPNSYLVVLNPGVSEVSANATRLADRYGGRVGFTYTAALKGFSVTMSEQAARRLAADPAVAYVEQDARISVVGPHGPTSSWGLDRIDQRTLPLDGSYTPPNRGSGVHAYIIDTGIRITHADFGGRAVWGTNTIDSTNTDCNGHGTHVAGIVGGNTYGVAKGVRLVAVKVLNCIGSGTISSVIAGVDWVTAKAVRPAVANIGFGSTASTALDTAVNNSIYSGITYVVAAGDSNANACTVSPARIPNAITVGASTSSDTVGSYINYGACLDLYAPGSLITSAWYTSDTATATLSGTSMASAHTTGAAAILLAANPTMTPAAVQSTLVNNATPCVLANVPPNSPDRLLYVSGPPTTLLADTFETDTTWVVDPDGTDTATSGLWEKGDPEAVTYGGVITQLGTTVSGTNGLVTGRLAGANPNDHDVDDGVTSIQSSGIALPATTEPLTLYFHWYLAHLANATSADYFRVSVVVDPSLLGKAGATVIPVFTQTGTPSDRSASWKCSAVDLSDYAGQSIRLRFEAADLATSSLIEAGVDDIRITLD